jgi:hypothetical protein
MGKNLKGGLIENQISLVFLVFIVILVFVAGAVAKMHTLVAGPPIKITTYGEQIGLDIFPVSALTLLNSDPGSQNAFERIADYGGDGVIIMPRSKFISYFEDSPEFYDVDFSFLNEALMKIEEDYSRDAFRREFCMIKHSQGLDIIIGLDPILRKSENNPGCSYYNPIETPFTFSKNFPYECSFEEKGIFSALGENMRVRIAVCCKGIKSCANYKAEVGYDFCNSDPCGVGPCRIVAKEKRVCAESSPPSISILARLEGDSEAAFFDNLRELRYKAEGEMLQPIRVDFRILVLPNEEKFSRAAIRFGGRGGGFFEAPSLYELGNVLESHNLANVEYISSNNQNPQDPDMSKGASLTFKWEYAMPGEYPVEYKVWHESGTSSEVYLVIIE